MENKPLIVQGRTSVDQSFATLEENVNASIKLTNETKEKIEKVLNEEFCNLDVKAEAQDNTCITQMLNFVVKDRIGCRIFQKSFYLVFLRSVFIFLKSYLHPQEMDISVRIKVLNKLHWT